jgi:hypothetical protein
MELKKAFCAVMMVAMAAGVSAPAFAQNRFMDEAREAANRRSENKAVREAEHPAEAAKPAATTTASTATPAPAETAPAAQTATPAAPAAAAPAAATPAPATPAPAQ